MKQKTKSSVYVDEDLVAWIDRKVDDKVFGSRNHAFELAVKLLKERIELIEQFLLEVKKKDSETVRKFIKELEKEL
ncbi:MAG: hypothetical protein AYK18_17205 [Theionarchaea archaeon DG-70]|nr:MAG: hypothetical protein AYK18_17205 [Theionarchaea archaeon DG-70]